MRYIIILLNPPSKHGSLAQQNIDDGFFNVQLALESHGAILYCSIRTLMLDYRNTRGYTRPIGGHARDNASRDRRLSIFLRLQLVHVTQYLYTKHLVKYLYSTVMIHVMFICIKHMRDVRNQYNDTDNRVSIKSCRRSAGHERHRRVQYIEAMRTAGLTLLGANGS